MSKGAGNDNILNKSSDGGPQGGPKKRPLEREGKQDIGGQRLHQGAAYLSGEKEDGGDFACTKKGGLSPGRAVGKGKKNKEDSGFQIVSNPTPV